ncbi:hypothetical protein NDU88_001701 [Pleurodeles waltl]|uniref:Uncharacterized protein n=1 Tax=Pleurodeles waltl TaxID=8319 RepID=A0AAV7MMG7_PLEWA|nr:hypothetical protein NDU88_001701 [Pleurodeles waltl]
MIPAGGVSDHQIEAPGVPQEFHRLKDAPIHAVSHTPNIVSLLPRPSEKPNVMNEDLVHERCSQKAENDNEIISRCTSILFACFV